MLAMPLWLTEYKRVFQESVAKGQDVETIERNVRDNSEGIFNDDLAPANNEKFNVLFQCSITFTEEQNRQQI